MLQYDDVFYMRQAILEAKKGKGCVGPGPCVGAVLVKNGHILARSHYKKFGAAHAEVNVFDQLKESAEGATLYVTLEPCSIFAKTPPCCDRIQKEKVARVVVGCIDPNPQICGAGVKKLRSQGIAVDVGVCADLCEKLIRPFATWIQKKRPYIHIKVALTLDGHLATTRGDSQWISNSAARALAHRLRAQSDAVLVGANTIAQDNPQLNVRDYDGEYTPPKIVVFSTEALDSQKRVFAHNREVLTLRDGTLSERLDFLAQQEIASILVEGGGVTISQFFSAGLVDELTVIFAPKLLGKGLPAFNFGEVLEIKEALQFTEVNWTSLGDNMVFHGRPLFHEER